MFVSSGVMFAWDLVFYLFKHIASNERGIYFCQKKKRIQSFMVISHPERVSSYFYFLFLSSDGDLTLVLELDCNDDNQRKH